MDLLSQLTATGESMLGPWWPIAWNLIKIVAIVLPLMGCVAYLTLWERKMIGWMHVRLGPNRVGPAGLLQPIADALKLLLLAHGGVTPESVTRSPRREDFATLNLLLVFLLVRPCLVHVRHLSASIKFARFNWAMLTAQPGRVRRPYCVVERNVQPA
mgnify:CR=1 FL=1